MTLGKASMSMSLVRALSIFYNQNARVVLIPLKERSSLKSHHSYSSSLDTYPSIVPYLDIIK